MKHLGGPIYFVYKLWIGFVFWITLFALYPAFRILLSRTEWFSAAFRLKRGWSRMLRWLMFCPIRIRYRSDLPKPPYIIVSNHSSYLDTVFMYEVFADYFLFIGKGELLKWPLFGLFFRKMDIPVKRESQKNAYQALRKAYEAIGRGECVAMYPEGTIPAHAPRMKAFKNGAFRMAVDQGVPIVPVTWVRNYRIMLDPSKLFSFSLPNTVEVVVHPPVMPEGQSDDEVVHLRNRVFGIIEGPLPHKYRRRHED